VIRVTPVRLRVHAESIVTITQRTDCCLPRLRVVAGRLQASGSSTSDFAEGREQLTLLDLIFLGVVVQKPVSRPVLVSLCSGIWHQDLLNDVVEIC
jgi:hypothetical protein